MHLGEIITFKCLILVTKTTMLQLKQVVFDMNIRILLDGNY